MRDEYVHNLRIQEKWNEMNFFVIWDHKSLEIVLGYELEQNELFDSYIVKN